MKILVLSDSHGHTQPAQRAIEREMPDAVVHLGDGWRDAQQLACAFPALRFEQVPGNCDLGRFEPCERLVFFGECPVFLCHGHTLGVKSSLLRATLAARQQGARVLLYGHTHAPLIDFHEGLWIMNPGSISPFTGSYGVLTIEGERISPATLRID